MCKPSHSIASLILRCRAAAAAASSRHQRCRIALPPLCHCTASVAPSTHHCTLAALRPREQLIVSIAFLQYAELKGLLPAVLPCSPPCCPVPRRAALFLAALPCSPPCCPIPRRAALFPAVLPCSPPCCPSVSGTAAAALTR